MPFRAIRSGRTLAQSDIGRGGETGASRGSVTLLASAAKLMTTRRRNGGISGNGTSLQFARTCSRTLGVVEAAPAACQHWAVT